MLYFLLLLLLLLLLGSGLLLDYDDLLDKYIDSLLDTEPYMYDCKCSIVETPTLVKSFHHQIISRSTQQAGSG